MKALVQFKSNLYICRDKGNNTTDSLIQAATEISAKRTKKTGRFAISVQQSSGGTSSGVVLFWFQQGQFMEKIYHRTPNWDKLTLEAVTEGEECKACDKQGKHLVAQCSTFRPISSAGNKFLVKLGSKASVI